MLDGVKEWFFGFALKKVAIKMGMGAAALVAAHNLDKVGLSVTVNPDALAVSIMGAFEMARNWLKVKKGVKWL